MMRALRVLIGLLLLAGAGFGGFVYTSDMLAATQDSGGGRPERGPLQVRTEAAQTMRFAETVEAVGTARARESVMLHPPAAGRVTEVAIDPGARVSEGDVLLRLDDAEARARLTATEATLTQTRAAHDRLQALSRSGSVTEANLEAARADMMRAEAEHALAETALRDRTLTAPFAGVVGFTDVARGELVDTATEVTTLDDLSVIDVAFSVPERYLSRLARGQLVELTSAAWPDRRFIGEISAIDTRVDETTRAIAMRARVPNDDRALTAGMFLRAALVLDERQATAVPERALSVAGDDSYIHIAEAGTARRVSVTTGRMAAGMIEVSGPVQPGDAVIVTNLANVSDGADVEVLAAEQARLEAPSQ
ncbi:membrane fusion protein, multidrug efflux system [Salipiger profundus]|uniref:Membrane fusion protein, multidrug efflux system n=2 Tax=Roseobacteraceae TaxID=2854170 RepID=A0A1U7D8X0_9RHOB|nr:membrane fusion protein, multidrug efflux system [Salipiger profundus]